ncbi:MAG: hypothetical protein QNK03_15645 [Myxococcota bacterium]|nr:hypothetical protein [Myxococcota bacterium]
MPRKPRAVVVVEPPRILVGDVAQVEVVVVTPPGHSVPPLQPPDELPGLWLLDAVAAPVERSASSWTHRTRIRVRGREAGALDWPALQLEVVDPEGERWSLQTEARPLEVVSILPAHPDRVSPFPYLLPERAARGPGPWAAAAGGAAAALALVGAVALVRRRRARGVAALPAAEAEREAPWHEALEALERATAALPGDWRQASHVGARALRRYLSRRFGLDLECCTTEEAETRSPPFALAGRWGAALDVLRQLDAVRFRREDPSAAARRVATALDAACELVRETVPPEAER